MQFLAVELYRTILKSLFTKGFRQFVELYEQCGILSLIAVNGSCWSRFAVPSTTPLSSSICCTSS